MAVMIEARNLSEAWLLAVEHLLSSGGTAVNLVTAIESTVDEHENLKMRGTLDEFLLNRRASRTWPVKTIANTIFPSSLYLPRLGDQARPHLYARYEEGRSIRRRVRANQKGTYFDRLIAWPGQDGPVNQLENVIGRLRSGMKLSSAYELGLTEPEKDLPVTEDLRIQKPGKDTSTMSFPCLSHISLTASPGLLHMTAMYRNQHFIRKAYGNYVGLAALLRFLAQETGRAPGELVCIATHADAEIRQGKGFGRGAIEQLVAICNEKATDRNADILVANGLLTS